MYVVHFDEKWKFFNKVKISEKTMDNSMSMMLKNFKKFLKNW